MSGSAVSLLVVVPPERRARLHIRAGHSQERLCSQAQWLLHIPAAEQGGSPLVLRDIRRVRRDSRVDHRRWQWVRKVEGRMERLQWEHQG